MSNHDGIENNKVYSSFRTSMDLGMGTIYLLFGALVIYGKYFGKVELQPLWAYLLGTLMLLYGIFRIYRGITAMQSRKK